MAENVKGPAAGTRSKTISGISEESANRLKPKKGEITEEKKKPQQKVLNDFGFKRYEESSCYHSDTEVIINSNLKKRSLSGRIYQLAIQISVEEQSKNSQAANSQKVDRTMATHMKGTNGAEKEAMQREDNNGSESATANQHQTAINMIDNSVTQQHGQSKTVLSKQSDSEDAGSKDQDGNKKRKEKENMQRNIEDPAVQDSGKTDKMQNYKGDEFFQMLSNMNKKLDTIQDDMKIIKKDRTMTEEMMAGMQYNIEDNQEAIVSQKTNVEVCMDKVDLLTNIMSKYEQKIVELTDRCNYLEAKTMKSELVILGLKDSRESCVTIAKNFFRDVMEMEHAPSINSAYWKGQGKNRPMIIKFTSQSEKSKVFSNVSKLKGKKNDKDRSYQINDHLPEELMEKQKRNRQIVAANKNLQNSDQLNIKINKGRLTVNGELYKKKISMPTVKEIMEIPSELLQVIKEIQVNESKEITESGSRFKMYAASTASIEQVRQKIQHVKRKHSGATHISVAYRLSGLNKAYDEDYIDDEEHSMGRRMLEYMAKKDVTDASFFMIRYYSGVHIGYRRFEICKELMDEVLELMERGIRTLSTLPLRCLISHSPRNNKRSKNRALPAIRGGTCKPPPASVHPVQQTAL